MSIPSPFPAGCCTRGRVKPGLAAQLLPLQTQSSKEMRSSINKIIAIHFGIKICASRFSIRYVNSCDQSATGVQQSPLKSQLLALQPPALPGSALSLLPPWLWCPMVVVSHGFSVPWLWCLMALVSHGCDVPWLWCPCCPLVPFRVLWPPRRSWVPNDQNTDRVSMWV